MRLLRWLALVGCLASSLLVFGQKEDWLPITPQDLQIKDVPGAAGAAAVQLYFADYIDDSEQTEFFYHRIKILNEKGNKWADVEIEIPPDGSIGGLKARTIHPDGTIVEFTGKPYVKTLIKGRGLKLLAKTFTMPEIVPGSIIEYKYKISWPFILTENFWTVQHDLYTVKEAFRMKPYQGPLEGFTGGYQVSAMYSHMPKDLKPVLKSEVYVMEAENIVAFEKEEYMPPEADFKPQVRFFYLESGVDTAEKFWLKTAVSLNSELDHFVSAKREISEAATQAIGSETDPEKKLRKLYERVQQVRNLTYERDRTTQEQKKENIKPNQNATDVLGRGYGSRNDVTKLFVALARSAGFNATVVAVSNRRDHFFERNLLAKRQLDAQLALVNVNGKDVYLDPGTKFCPYGLVRWMYTATAALKPDKKAAVFNNIPSSPPADAVTHRTGDLILSGDGTLAGVLTVEFKGHEALELRLEALETDDAGRKQLLEDTISELLPHGATAKLVSSKGWTSTEEPLIAGYKIELPNFASFAGKRVLMPSFMFEVKRLDAFQHTERKYPVYFTYPYAEIDNFNIAVPDGYKIESMPAKQAVSADFADYKTLAQPRGAKLNLQRVLVVGGTFFSLEHYPALKDFFNKVQAGDEQQAVLSGGSINADKGN
jgi:hypothetical protein